MFEDIDSCFLFHSLKILIVINSNRSSLKYLSKLSQIFWYFMHKVLLSQYKKCKIYCRFSNALKYINLRKIILLERKQYSRGKRLLIIRDKYFMEKENIFLES